MFTNLRATAQGFFAKAILFFLMGLFVLWGIGDVFRNMGAGSSVVASIGKTQISRQELQAMAHESHTDPRQALIGLINSTLVESEAKAMGIVVSDEAVTEFVRNIPQLKGKDGKFDKNIYKAVLSGTNRSEQSFLEDIRHEIEAKLLMGAFGGAVAVPEETVRLLYKVQQEQRAANLTIIPLSAVEAQVPAPTEQEIKTFYEAHSKDLLAPEVRSVSYVVLPFADVQSKITVPEEEIRRIYAERKDDFHKPERRQVEEMRFDNEEDAKSAAKELEHGAAFSHVVDSAQMENKGKTSLGLVAQQDLPAEVAGQVFALKDGGTTPPVFAGFRWHIYHVSKIETPRGDTFEEARAGIAKEISAREAQDTLSSLVNNFEDTMAGGATLEQAAEKAGQKVHTLPAMTHDAMLANGKKATLPTYDNFMSVAFSTPDKDHSQAVQTNDGSYFMVRVDNVTPEHVLPLEQVKAQVTRTVLEEKRHAQLDKVAQQVAGQVRAGKKPEEALSAAGVSAQTIASGDIKRDATSADGKTLPAGLMSELFRIRLHEATHAYPRADGSYVMATLTRITAAPEKPDPKILQAIRDELKTTLTNEVVRDYLEQLRNKYPISINAAALGMKSGESGEE